MESTTTIALPSTTRVWIYMADRVLTDEEVGVIGQKAKAFAAEWAAHGKNLESGSAVLHNRFLILMVNEDAHGASGCSIDGSVRFIKQLEADHQIDFFNRMLVAYQTDDGQVDTVPMSQLKSLVASGQLSADTIVFNNMVQTIGEMQTEWTKPLKDSLYARFI